MKKQLKYVIVGGLILILFLYHLCFILHPPKSGSSSGGTGGRLNTGNRIKRLPGCIMIGVRKGGTRALLDMLNLHSSIRAANFEVHFFDNDTNYHKGLNWYRDQMPSTNPNEIALEKSPSYFVTPSVPKRIHAMDRNVKLLLIVRDPLTRLISDYTQILHNHMEKGLVFKPFKKLALNPADGSINRNYDALLRSLYVNYMTNWLEYFPRNQIHVVNGEKLIKKPWQEIRKVEDFLGLKHEITRDNFFFNSTKGFHCIQKHEEEHCLAKSKGRSHPNISSLLVHKLRTFFRPYNYKFYDIVGQDFGWPDE